MCTISKQFFWTLCEHRNFIFRRVFRIGRSRVKLSYGLKLEQEIVVSFARQCLCVWDGTHVSPKVLSTVVSVQKSDRILKHINFELVDSTFRNDILSHVEHSLAMLRSFDAVRCVLSKKIRRERERVGQVIECNLGNNMTKVYRFDFFFLISILCQNFFSPTLKPAIN